MTEPPPRDVGVGLPLDGVLVVACEQAVAAPFATRQLADLGARVLKIERPGSGDFARDYDHTVRGLSSHFVWLNRSKESVTLDLKHPEAAAVMAALVARADVFVQNFAPGAAERLGLGADALRERHPRLITCSISGYGSSGPYRDAKAYDLLVQSEAGLVSAPGTPDEPAKSGLPAADVAAGMYAYSGILAALYDRERTGRGTALEVSLFDALVEWMGYPLYYTRYSGSPPPRTGTSHATITPYGTYAAGDGTEVVLSVQSDREWVAFCEVVLARPDLTRDPRFASFPARLEHREELDGEIAAALHAVTGEQFVERLDRARIANARLRSVAEVVEHPQLVARDRWRSVDTPVGQVAALLPPVVAAGRGARMDPVPDVGQHTDAVLAELGYDEQARAGLRATGLY